MGQLVSDSLLKRLFVAENPSACPWATISPLRHNGIWMAPVHLSGNDGKAWQQWHCDREKMHRQSLFDVKAVQWWFYSRINRKKWYVLHTKQMCQTNVVPGRGTVFTQEPCHKMRLPEKNVRLFYDSPVNPSMMGGLYYIRVCHMSPSPFFLVIIRLCLYIVLVLHTIEKPSVLWCKAGSDAASAPATGDQGTFFATLAALPWEPGLWKRESIVDAGFSENAHKYVFLAEY